VPFTFRKRINVLPFLRLNLSKSGASWTVHFGPWSWNSRTARNSVDLPGPVNWQSESPSCRRRPAR
jgi:hypothetical protein